MKKSLSLLVIMIIGNVAFSQITLLSQNFDNYDGDSANFIANYYVSWNSPASGLPSQSYYSSTGNFGLAPNSYKFGIDSATIITPFFAGADSLTFWHKGNGTGSSPNKFYIYASSDSIAFTLLDSITTFPSAGVTYGHGLDSSHHYLKFMYRKVVGNMAFDDLLVFNNQGLGITNKTAVLPLLVFPNPSSNGVFTFDFGTQSATTGELLVYNIIGNQVFSKVLSITGGKQKVDLSYLPNGSYFASWHTNKEQQMFRLIVK